MSACQKLKMSECRGKEACTWTARNSRVKGHCVSRARSRSRAAKTRSVSTSRTRRASVTEAQKYYDDVTQLLYQLVKDVHDVLVKFKIPYEIIGGTLLGAVRHGGMIPHDDDADIEIMKTYLPQLKSKVFPELRAVGYKIHDSFFGFQVSPSDGFSIKGYAYKFPFLDIFLGEVRDGRTYYTDTDEWNDKHYFEEMLLTPRRLYPFGPIQLYGPANPIPYLNRGFGNDWSSVWYRQYDHAHEREAKSKKEKMKFENFLPRVPVRALQNRITK